MVKIGIIGGGQLALMLGLSAKSKGASVTIYSNVKECPARHIADQLIVGGFYNLELLLAFASQVDKIIYEFENVDVSVIKQLPKNKLVTNPDILSLSQSRISEKLFATSIGIKTADYKIIGLDDLSDFNYPGLVKQDSLGYDGKGQKKVSSFEELDDFYPNKMILESLVDFDFEISVIFYKVKNQIYNYGVFQNKHKNSILFSTQLVKDSEKYFQYLHGFVDKLDFEGIICIECFVKGDEIIFNEIAPRVHNSGHLSLKSHFESQFDNLINICLDKPVNCEVVTTDLMLLQVLGQDYEYIDHNYNFFDYSKQSTTLNRKVGHLITTKSQVEKIIKGSKNADSFYKA